MVVTLMMSCVYVPPVWDVSDVINKTGFIKEGVSTRKEVIDKLGEPGWQSLNTKWITYTGHASEGSVFVCPDLLFLGCVTSGEVPLEVKSWWVSIIFDERDVVLSLYSSNEPVNDKNQMLIDEQKSIDSRMRAEQRELELRERALYDINAAYELGLDLIWSLSPEAWRWLCKAANKSHAGAQLELAKWYTSDTQRTANRKQFLEDIPVSNSTAVMWYILAKRNGSTAADYNLRILARKLSADQLAEGGRMAEAWSPGQCP